MEKELRKISFIIYTLANSMLFSAADLIEENPDNKTLWFEAVNLNNLEVVELLAAEVGVNTKDADGNIALHLAIAHNHGDLVNLLITHKADLSAVNNKMESPQDIAKSLGRLELLKKYIDELKDKSESTQIVAELMRLGKKKRKADASLDDDGAVIKKEVDEGDDSHIEKKHKGDKESEKPFKCDTCGYACKRQYDLTRHKRIHTGEKPFKCDECNYICRHKNSLVAHKLGHALQKPFKCEQCSCNYINKSNLTRHKLIHTGEKPFKCDACGYACKRQYDLTKHKRIHTGKKPFKCDHCNKAFIRKSDLNRHQLIHTKEKQYNLRRIKINELLSKVLPLPQVILIDSFLSDEY